MQRKQNRNEPASLRSVASSLSTTHIRGQKPNRKVTSKNENPADRIRPGRHVCDCQARIHGLIRNCMNCGRIVCEQEGSGPCFFCGTLVCTREERKIIEEGTPESDKMIFMLMGGSGKGGKSGWSTASSALLEAQAYKDKLLIADADSEKRTKVNDLESNYYSMENDAFLTQSEREAIIARKEELREIKAKQKRAFVVDFDLANASVFQAAPDNTPLDKDPVIQAIFEKAHKRQRASKGKVRVDWVPKGFVPKYDERIGRKSKNIENQENSDEEDFYYSHNNELMYAEVEKKGFAFPVDQPLASLLALGIRRHVPWAEDVYLRGPVFIASTTHRPSQKEIEKEVALCRQRTAVTTYTSQRDFPLDYPSGVIVGRALLVDCLSIDEYRQQFDEGEFEESPTGYILIFSTFEPLLVPVPHIPPAKDFYRVDKMLRVAIKQILDPYSFS